MSKPKIVGFLNSPTDTPRSLAPQGARSFLDKEANAKRQAQAQPQSSTQKEVLSKARNTVTAAQATTTQQRTDSPPAPVSTSLVSSTATKRTNAPESSIAIATEGTKDEDKESGEESGEGETGEEKEPIKKGKKVNEIKKEVTSIDVNTPIKRKEINIYNKSFLVETKVDSPLTEEQGLLYEQLYLPEFEGEEDEAWRKQVLQEVINSCTGDFGITTDPKCDIMRSYLEKLALKVFETDQPILWWKDKEVEEKKEDVVYPNEPETEEDEEKEENEEDEDEATDYEIMISISLSDLHNLLTPIPVKESETQNAPMTLDEAKDAADEVYKMFPKEARRALYNRIIGNPESPFYTTPGEGIRNTGSYNALTSMLTFNDTKVTKPSSIVDTVKINNKLLTDSEKLKLYTLFITEMEILNDSAYATFVKDSNLSKIKIMINQKPVILSKDDCIKFTRKGEHNKDIETIAKIIDFKGSISSPKAKGIHYLPWRSSEKRWATESSPHRIIDLVNPSDYGDWHTIIKQDMCPDKTL